MSAQRERKERRMKDAQDLANQTRGFEDTDLKLPDGCEKFLLSKYKSGEVIAVDFMPFIVGKGNPDCDEEWIYYRRVYWTHRLPTPKAPRGQEFCCDGVFGRGRCRVCRWLEKVNNAELAKECKRKTKLLWLLNDKPGTPPGEGNPWKVFKSNDFNRGMGFGEQMQAALKAMGSEANKFFDLKEGLTAKLTILEQPPFGPGSKPYNAVARIDFIARKYKYSSSLLEKAPCLDDMLVDTEDDVLLPIIGDGEEPEKPARSARSAAKEPDSAVEPSTPEPSEAESSSVEEPSDASASAPEGSSVEEPSTPEPVAARNGKAPAFKLGQFVTWKKKEWEVKKISSDGTLTLEDQDGHMKHASPNECKAVPVADAGSDVEPDSAVEPSDVEDPSATDSSPRKPSPKPKPATKPPAKKK